MLPYRTNQRCGCPF